MKTCASCGLEKDESEFNFKIRGKLLQPSCKVCTRAQSRKYYQTTKQQHLERVTKNRQHRQARLLEFKSQLSCCKCGETSTACLDFHHVDPNEKEHAISKISTNWSWDRLMQEIKKCIVVCSNCHRKIHAGEIQG